jgi:hypothetical protein
MNRTKAMLAGLGIVAAMSLGTTAALAQNADEPTTDAQPLGHDDFATRLAEELGIDVDRVTEALETVRTQIHEQRQAEHLDALGARLDAAVEAGQLTREQADAILEAAEAGVLGGHGFGGHHGRGHHGGFGRGGFGSTPDGEAAPDADATPEAQPSSTDISA